MLNGRDYTSEYVFHEFPKWVTLADGSQMIARNAEEEAVLVGESKTDDERQALMDRAKELGLDPHHRTGVEKLREMIKAAES